MEYISGFYSFVTNGVPSYTQTCYDIKWGLEYWYSNVNDFSPQTFSKDLQKYALPYFEVKKDLAVIVGLAVLWTILRYALTFAVFQVCLIIYVNLLLKNIQMEYAAWSWIIKFNIIMIKFKFKRFDFKFT